MRLAQLETTKTRCGKERGSLRIKSLDFFLLLIKNNSIVIYICSLVEDGVYTVIASIEENLTKKLFLYTLYFRSQRPFLLAQKQADIWNH